MTRRHGAPRRGEAGQTSVEYLGLILLVVAVIAAIAATGIGATITARITCAITHDECGATDAADGPQGAGVARPPAARPSSETEPGGSGSLNPRRLRASAAAASPGRSSASLNGVIEGRAIDTSRYRRGVYCKRYRCKKPSMTKYPMPDLQGRRGGKLRIALFIKQGEVRPGGVAPVVFQGDDRDFDKRFDASRTRVTFIFDFKRDELTILVNPSCSKGASVLPDGCSNPEKGKVTVAAGSNGKGDRAPYSVDYSLKDSRTRVPLLGNPAPALDGRITLTPFRDTDGRRRIRVTIYNDPYPSLEAYYDPSGSEGPRTLCRDTEGYASELAGAAGKRCENVF